MPEEELTLDLDESLPPISGALPLPPLTLAYAGAFSADFQLLRKGLWLIQPTGGRFPDRCVKCNVPTSAKERWRKTRQWHHPAYFLLILIALPIYVIVAICIRKTVVIDAGLCPACRRQLRKKIWYGCGVVLLGILLIPVVLSFSADTGHNVALFCLLLASVAMIFGSIIFMALTAPALKVKYVQPDATAFVGAGEAFLRFPANGTVNLPLLYRGREFYFAG